MSSKNKVSERESQVAFLGKLMGEVAHEIHNPLASIQLNIDAVSNLVQEIPEKIRSKMTPRLETTQRSIKQISYVVGQIQNMATQSESPFERLDLHKELELIKENFHRLTPPHKATLTLDLQASSPFFFGNHPSLQQVFTNLIRNSLEAGPGIGRSSLHIDINTSSRDHVLMVEFKDDGAGISPSQLALIFNPFFTTKKARGNMGLGLSIVEQRLKSHGATIEASSLMGEGTTFLIQIPHDRRLIKEKGLL